MTLRVPSLGAIAILVALQASAQSNPGLRPLADHHAHLNSVAFWRLLNERLPTVALPPDLDELLRAFERNWRAPDNKTALANQFTDSGLFQYADDWLRGRAAIRMMLVGSGGPLRLHAQAFE